ncbi:MAG: hypothetical protein MEP57_03135 [Microvirga sp.]|nr:hypothetical protein [Microvirga sp.]
MVLHPAGTTGEGYEIELIGEIAQMVEVALEAGDGRSANKKAARGGAALSADERRSVKVVAGA